MKTLLVALLLLVGTIDSPAAEDDRPPAPVQSTKLQKLNTQYERRRAKALRPVTTWYRAQLEVLGAELEKEQRAIVEAKRMVAKTFWEDDQPELKEALLSQNWKWCSELNREGVAMKYSGDGTVHHIGLNGTWKITGPNEVTIQPDDDGTFILRFNSSLTTFVGDRRGVTGERQPLEKQPHRQKR